MRRREFITLMGSAVAVSPLATHAQSPMPVIGFVSARSPGESASVLAAFRKGLSEVGYVESRNVHIAFRWAEGRYERLPGLVDDLVKQKVSVITAVGPPPRSPPRSRALRFPWYSTSDLIRSGQVWWRA